MTDHEPVGDEHNSPHATPPPAQSPQHPSSDRPLDGRDSSPNAPGAQASPTGRISPGAATPNSSGDNSKLGEAGSIEGGQDKKDDAAEEGDNGDDNDDDDDEGEEEDDGEEDDDEEDDEEDDDDEDDEEEEPYLKYTPLTQHLRGVYRNGDASSAFLVAGDKMIVGTHNGNIHVVQLPTFQPIRVYHAHSASVTGISISPFPPPLPTDKPETPQARPASRQAEGPAAASRRSREPQQVPRTLSNDIYIATSSLDGNVCVQSLVDPRDVQLRNFARPVQAVALSPDYKNDRTYLSGGLDGQLILTVGGGTGRSTSTTTGAAATASGWLGSMGIGSNTGRDTIQHSGEGTINTIQWSLSGKYVVWLNEHGFKIIRTHLHLDSSHSDDAWKRICHIDRPDTPEWEAMASVWKGRAEWIDETAFENQDVVQPAAGATSPAMERLRQQAASAQKSIERLLVGWGGTVWVVHVDPNSTGSGKKPGDRTPGEGYIVKMLRLDCIISGISLYTQRLLLVLAYCTPEDEDGEDQDPRAETAPRGHKPQISVSSAGSHPSGGIPRNENHQRPELRLIDLESEEEASMDSLTVSRYERLSARDYHLGILPPYNAAAAASSRGVLDALGGIGNDVWNAAINPKSLFGSGASIRSRGSGDDGSSIQPSGSVAGTRPGLGQTSSVHPNLVKPGAKIFIHSPFDCILATRRDLSDHLSWLLEHQEYQKGWELLDSHPDLLAQREWTSEAPIAGSMKHQRSTEDLFDDESIAESSFRAQSSVEKEKLRIGELWIEELIEQGKWLEAARICNKVLTVPDRWEKWVWRFAGANRFDEIADFLPTEPTTPPLPATIYEVVLGHYVKSDKPRFRELLDRWPTDLFDIRTITTALENQLKYRDVREDSVEDGEKGRDWRIVVESLARLHEANGRHREALKCYIKLQDADSAFRLIRDSHLADSVADNIPGFIGLRVSPENLDQMTGKELEEATSEAITLLVEEAQHGLVQPRVVVEQLQAQDLHVYLYFYLRALWKGEGLEQQSEGKMDRLVMDSQSLVDEFADLAVQTFAAFNRSMLMEYLKASTSYVLEKAVQVCEQSSYYDELVYLYSKTGQMKRALYLIIDRLQDVHKAIEFAKEQDDADLWEDLLNYSMDKPSFIRGLLEQAGTAIDPIRLVQRIPEGLEVQGLREGLTHMMREHEIQYSISSGAARVLRSEVAAAQNELRSRQRKGLKFEVAAQPNDSQNGALPAVDAMADAEEPEAGNKPQPGCCAKCQEPFTEFETETLVGYPCGHIYHVSHLLEMLHGGSMVDADLGPGTVGEGGRYSVGRKVMRARLLRDKVRAGCPLCDSEKQ